MLNKLKQQKSEGFTIIEVVIVLAIAGLIILVVLLAVPALQRNGRNTAIKSDASAIAAGVSEYSSNNDGLAPSAAGSSNNNGTITIGRTGAGAGTPATAKIQGGTDYNDGQGAANVTAVASQVIVRYGAKCPAGLPTNAQVNVTANNRSAAVIYPAETSTGLVARCLDA